MIEPFISEGLIKMLNIFGMNTLPEHLRGWEKARCSFSGARCSYEHLKLNIYFIYSYINIKSKVLKILDNEHLEYLKRDAEGNINNIYSTDPESNNLPRRGPSIEGSRFFYLKSPPPGR